VPGGRPPNGSKVSGRGSNPAVAGPAGCRAINEDVGGCWPRATSVFRAKREIRRCSEASFRRRSRAQGERRKRTRDQRGVSWLNASERADVTVGAPEPTPG